MDTQTHTQTHIQNHILRLDEQVQSQLHEQVHVQHHVQLHEDELVPACVDQDTYNILKIMDQGDSKHYVIITFLCT